MTLRIRGLAKRALVVAEDLYYKKVIKNLLKTSKLGRGVVLTGAESGVNFEHIYNNKPEGSFLIGRYVDKALLSLKTAQATRGRKETIKKMLNNEIQNNRLFNRKTKILDLASGTARYLRELSEEHLTGAVESTCIDKDSACIKLGRDLVKRDGIPNIRFFRGNIFHLNHLRKLAYSLEWKPNVIIASGLFMYFNDDRVEEMLREIYDFLPPGGLLIFSSYERVGIRKLMRKTMTTSTGEPWILYYRKPEHVRHVLHKIGFEQIFVIRDQWEMSNICLGRKPERICCIDDNQKMGQQ